MKVNNKIKSTAVLTDIRNFSSTFKDFQINRGSDAFLSFLEEYFELQHTIASSITDKFFMSSTGDGVLAVFTGKNHYKNGYAYILVLSKALDTLCKEFNDAHEDVSISYGIGADSGHVWSIGSGVLSTYVGTVINRAARIEAKTKEFSNTTVAVGNSLYKYLLKEYHPKTYSILKSYDNYDELLTLNPDAILVSEKLLLYYVFDMPLKGIDASASIFRISNTLKNGTVF